MSAIVMQFHQTLVFSCKNPTRFIKIAPDVKKNKEEADRSVEQSLMSICCAERPTVFYCDMFGLKLTKRAHSRKKTKVDSSS